MVVSEASNSVASKRLLIENMQMLAEQNVQVIYLEHLLTDVHTAKLQKYRTISRQTNSGSHEIKHFLDTVQGGALKSRQDKYDYYHLIKTAHRHGIEVKPLNTSVSYDFSLPPVAAAADDPLATRKMSAFIGNKIIASDVANAPGRRWIALLDHRLATTHDEVPGVAQMQGAVSIRVKDVEHQAATRVTPTAGEELGRTDFTVEMANPDLKATPAPSTSHPPALNSALDAMFNRESLIRWELDPTTGQIVRVDDANASTYAGRHGFIRDTDGKWRRAAPESDSGEEAMTPLQLSLKDADYELPSEQLTAFHQLVHFENHGTHPEYFFFNLELEDARGAFFTRRAKLQQDAKSLSTMELPPRPPLPEVTGQPSQQALLDSLYRNSRGVVIGEAHSDIGSKRFIIDNMRYLAANDVKTLYLEHLLTDVHQLDLDRFAQTGVMSKRLLHDLKVLDRGQYTDPAGIHNFEALVIRAREHGIEVRAIDCAASYHVKDLSAAGNSTRQSMMNYFASRVIRRHQAVVGEHKWIALVGNSHANTFRGTVPGLAELEGAIGLRLMDVKPGSGRGLLVDPGELVPERLTNKVLVKCDLRLEIEIDGSTRVSSLATPADRVPKTGQFLVDDSEPAALAIWHRARDGQAYRTPVLLNEQSQFYVERPSWHTAHGKAFDRIGDLIDALKAFGLRQVR